MTTRREVLPLLTGAVGAVSVGCTSTQPSPTEPELRRVSYTSQHTGTELDYFVYLPRGHATRASWPVILYLHGDGDRGDGKADLDFVLCHGPIYEAWIQRRDLPFVMIAPQLPLFGLGEAPFFKNRTRNSIPQRAATPPERPDENTAQLKQPMQGAPLPEPFKFGADEDRQGWQSLETELVSMIDQTIAEFRGDPRRVHVTGLSRGGFGAWHFAARHTDKVAAVAPSSALDILTWPTRSRKRNSRCGNSPVVVTLLCRCDRCIHCSTGWSRSGTIRCVSPCTRI